jgi:hypothetical protein
MRLGLSHTTYSRSNFYPFQAMLIWGFRVVPGGQDLSNLSFTSTNPGTGHTQTSTNLSISMSRELFRTNVGLIRPTSSVMMPKRRSSTFSYIKWPRNTRPIGVEKPDRQHLLPSTRCLSNRHKQHHVRVCTASEILGITLRRSVKYW